MKQNFKNKLSWGELVDDCLEDTWEKSINSFIDVSADFRWLKIWSNAVEVGNTLVVLALAIVSSE